MFGKLVFMIYLCAAAGFSVKAGIDSMLKKLELNFGLSDKSPAKVTLQKKLGDSLSTEPDGPSCPVVSITGPTTPFEAKTYFLRFGYLSADGDQTDFTKAIQLFQKMANLNQTGKLDKETYGMLQLGRCGNLDVSGSVFTGRPLLSPNPRRKRYLLQGSRWNHQHITYRISKYTPDLTRHQVDQTMAKAFQIWANVTPLTFTQSKCDDVDIEIKFVSGDHGDGDPFDGRGGVLGHAIAPYQNEHGLFGDIHYDEAELWKTGISSEGSNLLVTAAHEIGHSLGLRHSDVKGSIMQFMVSSIRGSPQLHQDDIDGIQLLYGSPVDVNPMEPKPDTCGGAITTSTAVTTKVLTTTETTDKMFKTPSKTIQQSTTTESPSTTLNTPIMCSGQIDAITRTSSGKTYAFRGNQVYSLNSFSVDEGFPRNISSVFPRGPSYVDAAVTVKVKHNRPMTFLFSGSNVWRYSTVDDPPRLEPGYPRTLYDDFNIRRAKIDYAFYACRNRYYTMYLVSGSKYLKSKFSRTGRVRSRLQDVKKLKPVNVMANYNITAAFRSEDERKNYFFTSDSRYFRFTGLKPSTMIGPRDTAPWWFGCQTTH